MPQVLREEIVDNERYERERPQFRTEILKIKALRRVHVGSHLTFLFENADTMRYQIQEMMRIEQIADEDGIQHELTTYNELLGGLGELGCTLLIEIDDPLQRDIVLRKWLGLPQHLYMRCGDNQRVSAIYDERQVGTERLSSVQYLKFPCDGMAPTHIGIDMPGLEIEVDLSAETRRALAEDMGVSPG